MQSRLEYLFECYVQRNCSSVEEEELMGLLAQSENREEVQKLLVSIIENTDSETKMPEETAASMLKNILQKDKVPVVDLKGEKTVFMSWKRVAAAVVILFISGAAYLVVSRQNKGKVMASTEVPGKQTTKILPGGNHATLTLADGSTIELDSVQNGNIQRGNATITKQGGLLVYDESSQQAKAGTDDVYNTLTTPRGGQYKLILADGSKVWLNASSSLRFPTAFTGKERNVELKGEAYFEVAKNKGKPFHVNVNGMQVEVLGTHFNVNGYSDENSIKTSLLEGSVRIKRGRVSALLKPGQQGILENNNDLNIKKVNMDDVIAWKNGLFQFDGAGIKTIMQEIGRWYNVEIVYSGKVPERSFVGKISRDAALPDVLKILELSNVKFNVVGRKIIVQ